MSVQSPFLTSFVHRFLEDDIDEVDAATSLANHTVTPMTSLVPRSAGISSLSAEETFAMADQNQSATSSQTI